MFGKSIYESEMALDLSTTKKSKVMWSRSKSHIHPLLQYADQEFYSQRFAISRKECAGIDMIVSILEQLLSYYIDNSCIEYPTKKYSRHFSTDGYEYSFIITNAGKRIGYQISDFHSNLSEKDIIIRHRLDELAIIVLEDKETFDRFAGCRKFSTNNAYEICLEDFFNLYFPKEEFSDFSSALQNYLSEARDILGYNTVSFLSSFNLLSFKKRIESDLLSFPYRNTHYIVLDHNCDDTKKHLKLEETSLPESDLAIIEKRFFDEKLYKAMLGTSDFAHSFITSEWLYYALKDNPYFDYTSIILGYAKSIEQLLYKLIMFSKDRPNIYISLNRNLDETVMNSLEYQIVKKTDKRNNKTFKYIPLTTDNIEKEYIDDSLWALQQFLFMNSWYLSVKESAKTIFSMIDCYRQESRNEHFHKTNMYNWDTVEKIRSNTIFLYYLLLGSYPISFEELSKMEVPEEDAFDSLCIAIRKLSRREIAYKISFDGTTYQNALYHIHKNAISIDNNGNEHYTNMVFWAVPDFSTETYISIDNGTFDPTEIVISRTNFPKSVIEVSSGQELVNPKNQE